MTDFTQVGDDGGLWTGTVASGTASTSSSTSGLCMTVAKAGENVVSWSSSEKYIELVDNMAYRVRVAVTTDQTVTDKIPYWSIGYDNYSSSGNGGLFAGEATFMDAFGGANGIGRANGRQQFDVFIAPAAVSAPQWRGFLAGEDGGAFDPSVDQFNDIRLRIGINDTSAANVNANFDEGTICVRSVRVDRISLDDLKAGEVLYDAPISSTSHRAALQGQTAQLAQFDNARHAITYQLDPNDRVTLTPFVTQGDKMTMYPVVWEDNTLYRVTAEIQSALGSSETDPVDAIGILADTATRELTQSHYMMRGTPGNMYRAGSPRTDVGGGGPQVYTSFFFGQNATDSSSASNCRLRPMVDIYNSTSLYGSTNGNDPLEVLSLKVTRMILPRDIQRGGGPLRGF